jgi:hypothetical protein
MTVTLNKKGDIHYDYELETSEKIMQRPSTAALLRTNRQKNKSLLNPNTLNKNIMMDSKSTLNQSSNTQSYTNLNNVKIYRSPVTSKIQDPYMINSYTNVFG